MNDTFENQVQSYKKQSYRFYYSTSYSLKKSYITLLQDHEDFWQAFSSDEWSNDADNWKDCFRKIDKSCSLSMFYQYE